MYVRPVHYDCTLHNLPHYSTQHYANVFIPLAITCLHIQCITLIFFLCLEAKGISVTSTILTALERDTTYYIWVVGVPEGGEGPHSDRKSAVTNDSE